MDHVAYDPRFQQYQGQPGFWPYVYPAHAHLQQPHSDSTYHTHQNPSQGQLTHYGQHATQTPAHMATQQWVALSQEHQPQAFGHATTSYQYAQSVPPTTPTLTDHNRGTDSQATSPMSVVAPQTHAIVPYQGVMQQVVYYPSDVPRGLVHYPMASGFTAPHYTSHPTHTVPETSYQQVHQSSWQYIEPARPVPGYVVMQQQPLANPNHAPPIQQSSGPVVLKIEAEESSLPQSHYSRPQTHSEVYEVRPVTSDSRSSSTTESSESPNSSASVVSIKRDESPDMPTPRPTTRKLVAPVSKKKENSLVEKKVGKRTGPLSKEKREQAGMIRKCKACLRCKFLKKTCDTGNPCSGCRPSHARLWQVPCTRIAIQDVGYFAQEFENYMDRRIEVKDVLGESRDPMWISVTHGFGVVLPIKAHGLFVKDPRKYQVEWTEGRHSTRPQSFNAPSAMLKPVEGSITEQVMSNYVDMHIDGGFENFVDNLFDGTKFITEMLKTLYKYYCNTKLPILRKALKLVVAYNLTSHITMADGLGEEAQWDGEVRDMESKHYGRHVAPLVVNLEVKKALTSLWRGLMKEVLIELAALYTGVYTGNKLKDWPTIFMLDTVLLAVWEEMQFDYQYQAVSLQDAEAPRRFCRDMEGIPVGVIVGLFLAISQKLPNFLEWDSRKHHHVLNSDIQACNAMTEVREHVAKHEDYLRSRSKDCRFDYADFDSLSNKFVSRLVVRAN